MASEAEAEPIAYELTDWKDCAPQIQNESATKTPGQGILSNAAWRHLPGSSSRFMHTTREDPDDGDVPLISPAPTRGINIDATAGPRSRIVDTAYRGYDADSRADPNDSLDRSRSLLQRLASLKPARLNTRRDRYHALEDPGDRGNETFNVDLSSLEGRSYFQPNAATQDHPTKSLGSGVVVGKEVQAGFDNTHPNADINLKLDPAADRLTRTATIRKYGQKLAQDTNAIVTVREAPVDLTSLEGLSPDPLESQKPKEAPTDLADMSYFYPADPEQPNWRPFPMRPLYIIMLAIVSLSLAAVQEYLCQRSTLAQGPGGLIQYNSASDISTAEFFCWKYLPTIVMVSYGVLWQITDYDVKRLEPYYQLSQPTGSTADKGLNLDYVTLWAYFVPVKAIKNRHWAVLVSSIGTILATTAAPSVQNPSIMAVEDPDCKDAADCGKEYRYTLRIHPIWSRLVTACLIIVALIAVILLFQLRRKSGLLSDPCGVAGIASMATKSHILTDFHGMDECIHDEIHEKLRHRRYILYKSTIWQGECIKPTTEKDRDDPSTSKPQNPHPMILRKISLLAFVTFMAVCLAFITAISYTDLSTTTNTLPWLAILVATLIKQLWATLEFAVKMIEPFHTLSLGDARPDLTLTLDYQGVPYGLLPFKALLKGHYLVALSGVCSILADILTVTFSSLSVAADSETASSFFASSTLSITILALLIAATVAVLLTRSRTPCMPRQPATIASVLAFIHQSRMLDDFVGTERFSHTQMENFLVRIGKRYALGWFRGRDGRPHCAIDQEPLLSRYVHGVSYVWAQAPWEENVAL
ncbi:hypothetical protein PHISP_04607 [Aspergillus sp. HF37]|nr:hypothetical protein PHISP_04607 [Aspergillus sp. HF37]